MIRILSSFLILSLLLACNAAENKKPQVYSLKPLRTAKVENRGRSIQIAGTVQAADQAQLASRFAGFVREVHTHAGDRVQKNTLLVVLDDSNLQAQREKATSGRQQASKAAEAAAAQSKLAAATFERIRTLYERKSASQQEFDEASSKKEAAEAAYQAALQQVSQSESDLQDVAANSRYLRIVAPFDGVVTSVPANSGTFVNPGEILVSLENPGSYEIRFAVEEQLLHMLRLKQTVTAVIPALSNSAVSVTITEVSTAIDANTHSFIVKAELPRISGLRSGLSATVFVDSNNQKSLWIPQEFLTQSDDVDTVVVREGTEWKRVLVKSGVKKDGAVEILSGLKEGEEVAVVENPQ